MKKTSCRTDKYYYKANNANRKYKTTLVDSREGINMTEADLIALDSVVSPLIKQGQSPYVILQNHPHLGISEKTLYNYIESGALSVKNLDLYKKVKYKPRSTKPKIIKDTGIYQGRTYADFCSLIEEYPDTNVVEMDTVHGCKGSKKVLLTFFFRNCSLLLAFLINDLKPASVNKVFDELEKKMTTIGFLSTFPVILTDRGFEFSNPDALETGKDNCIRTRIFFCDPMASWQKARIEKEHESLRRIWPKGSSFDDLKQFQVNTAINHICNQPRASINGLTPLKLAQLLIHEEALKVFNLYEIDCDSVTLIPSLVK
jgi:IS30 family transposase